MTCESEFASVARGRESPAGEWIMPDAAPTAPRPICLAIPIPFQGAPCGLFRLAVLLL
jgi:hypothetical protein